MYNINEKNRILSPKTDLLFKQIFFNKDDTEGTLTKLLQDCIGFNNKQLAEITLLDRAVDGDTENDKSIILDINAKLSDGSLVNIEVQRTKQVSFNERSIFYTSKRLASQGYKGFAYEQLRPTIALNIVDFDAFNDTDEFYSSFYLMEETRHTKLSDVFRIDFLELKKLNNMAIDKNNKKELWVRFFNAESKEELDMLKEADPTFEKVVDRLVFLSSDPSVLTAYEQEEKMRMDKEAQMSYARNEGIEQGIEQGKLAERVKTYQMMMSKNYTEEMFLDIYNISEEELEEIRTLAGVEVNNTQSEDFTLDM